MQTLDPHTVSFGEVLPPIVTSITRREIVRRTIEVPDEGLTLKLEVTLSFGTTRRGQQMMPAKMAKFISDLRAGEEIALPPKPEPREVLRYMEGCMWPFLGGSDAPFDPFCALVRVHYSDIDRWSREQGLALILSRLCSEMEFSICVPQYEQIRSEVENLRRQWHATRIAAEQSVTTKARSTARVECGRLLRRIDARVHYCDGYRAAYIDARAPLSKLLKDRRARIYQICLYNRADLIAATGHGMDPEHLAAWRQTERERKSKRSEVVIPPKTEQEELEEQTKMP